MTNETTNHEFICNIDTANEEVERLQAENADLKTKLAAKPAASAAPSTTPTPSAPRAETTSKPPIEQPKLTGLARAAAANSKLQPKQK